MRKKEIRLIQQSVSQLLHTQSTFFFFFSIIYSANAWIHTIAIYANTRYISNYIRHNYNYLVQT